LIAGLEKPSSGKAIVLGQDVQDLDDEAMANLRAQKMGIVFQNYYLIPHLTAIENILLPLQLTKSSAMKTSQQKEQAMELLKRVKLESRAHHFSHQLSGGEAQRVALARALIHKPQLVLADEPSGNLDEETGIEVMDLLFGLVKSQEQTLVLVTHNKVLAQRCRKNFLLKAGQLQEV
jgi:putative ABC transport system ATP-binding protein